MAEPHQALAAFLEEARDLVIFTGAGVSTECGIPDFRSPGGVWDRHQPIEFSDFIASEESRAEAWRRKFLIDDEIGGARPGRAHVFAAAAIAAGRASAIVTQNIDGLHQAAGVPDDSVIELHGNGTYAACLECAARVELPALRAEFMATGRAPDCARCGGIVKSATISFGQPMPAEPMRRAAECFARADAVLVLGSSLVVRPAAHFPAAAAARGVPLAIVNLGATPLDVVADLVIRRDIGDTLAGITGFGAVNSPGERYEIQPSRDAEPSNV